MANRGSETRQAFIDYFARVGHTPVPSAPLVPQGDATLMFVNAGMVPFKNVFVGQEQRPYDRAVSSQKCMRVSGKHNDLEEVGRTARHHTFFEMLGNFSFGDYFKEQAIEYAWAFVRDVLGIDKQRLFVTVFAGENDVPADDEARALWKRISGLGDERILAFGAKDNFWSMGETGPCGPCTEIHVDLGTGPVTPADFENGRIVEIWNNVFMQYERHANGSRTPLPKPAVDTGMGLERVAAITQGQHSNYHSDLFLPLLARIEEVAQKRYGRAETEDDVSMRVIADHARALCFLVADGVQPGPDGRGYVLRRILRRAIRHAQKLGIEQTFLPSVAGTVVDEMHVAYPELKTARTLIEQVAAQEEESFRRTLDSGLKLLSTALDATLGQVQHRQGGKAPKILGGDIAFKLYDTYGFPKDLTALIAKERDITLDEAGFAACMREQQERSRGARESMSGADTQVYRQLVLDHGPSTFVGYPHEADKNAVREGHWQEQDGFLMARVQLQALIDLEQGRLVPTSAHVASLGAVLSPCPLYGEGGGQVGDQGRLCADAGAQQGPGAPIASVSTTQRPIPEVTVARLSHVHGTLKAGTWVWAGYPIDRRLQTRAHHSATHLLHGALRKVLGDHVTQAGSLVDPAYLRFDFAHFQSMTEAELEAVEADVNRRIAAASRAVIEEMDIEAAQQKGALALFGEKYAEKVRVISLGESIELCGGTHVDNTQEIGLLLLQKDQAVKAGVRRLTAEVGEAATRRGRLWLSFLAGIADRLGADKAADAFAHAAGHASRDAARKVALQEPSFADVDAAVSRLQQTIAQQNELVASTSPKSDASEEDEVPVELPVSPDALGVTQPVLDGSKDLAFWRKIRATWQAVAAIALGKAAEAQAAQDRVRDDDIGHVATGVFNLAATEREATRWLSRHAAKAQAKGAKDMVANKQTLENGLVVLCEQVDAAAGADLKTLADHLRDALKSAVVCLAQADGERVRLLVARTPDLDGRVHAGKLVSTLAPLIGGKGGGRPDLAQAGGRDAVGIAKAFEAFLEAVGKL